MYYPDIVDPKFLKPKSISLEDELNSVAYVFIRLCQFFGASPIEVYISKKQSQNDEKSDKKHNSIVIAHRAWCFVYMMSVICSLIVKFLFFDKFTYNLKRFLTFDSYVLITINLMLILSGNHQRGKNFFAKIALFDERLLQYVEPKKKGESLLSYKRYRAFVWGCVAVAGLVIGLSAIIDSYYNDFQFVKTTISYHVYIVSNITFALCHIQYLGMLQLFRWRSQQINVSLKRILSADDNANNLWSVGISMHKPHSLNVSLNEIRLLHLELNYLIKSLNESFGYILLAFFASTVLVVIATMFSIYLRIQHWAGYLNVVNDISYPILWAFLHMMQIVMFLHLNERLNQEVY